MRRAAIRVCPEDPMQKRKSIAALVAAVAAMAMVEAGAASLSEDRLVACAGITDSALRVACYDREVAPLAREVAERARASGPAAPTPPPVPTPAPATVSTPAPTTATTPAPSFGEEQLTREQRPAPEKEELTLHARLSSQKTVGAG